MRREIFAVVLVSLSLDLVDLQYRLLRVRITKMKQILRFFAALLWIAAANARDVTVLDDDSDILFEDRFWISREAPFQIMSNVPVTVSHYLENIYLEGQQPMLNGEVYIFLRSNCSDGFEANVSVTNTTEFGQILASEITIDVAANDMSPDPPPRNFLDQLSFFAQWSYMWFFGCGEAQLNNLCSDAVDAATPSPSASPSSPPVTSPPTPSKEPPVTSPTTPSSAAPLRKLITLFVPLLSILVYGGSRFRIAVLVAAVALLISYGTKALDDSTMHRQAQEGVCMINAEVLYDSCSTSVQIVAPLVRVFSGLTFDDLTSCSIVDDSTESVQDPPPCTTYYNSTLSFPELVQEFSNEEEDDVNVTIPPETSDICVRAIEGRPYVDETGISLRAEVSQEACSSWSLRSSKESSTMDSPSSAALWKDRGLAEHASVASFASVAMALLTNGAPPDLVSDTLLAALDEVRHAQLSFEIASSFVSDGAAVEPGPLPTAVHRYEQNLTKLALSAVKEGCVDETLSALSMAAELDAAKTAYRKSSGLIFDRLKNIAGDEGTHSTLAWRTVHWACLKDQEARQAVKIFFANQGKWPRRLQSLDLSIGLAWKRIHEELVPLMGLPVEDVNLSIDGLVCSEQDSTDITWKEDTFFTDQLTDRIVHNVICALGGSIAASTAAAAAAAATTTTG